MQEFSSIVALSALTTNQMYIRPEIWKSFNRAIRISAGDFRWIFDSHSRWTSLELRTRNDNEKSNFSFFRCFLFFILNFILNYTQTYCDKQIFFYFPSTKHKSLGGIGFKDPAYENYFRVVFYKTVFEFFRTASLYLIFSQRILPDNHVISTLYIYTFGVTFWEISSVCCSHRVHFDLLENTRLCGTLDNSVFRVKYNPT